MDFWHKARSFADEATKRTHDLTAEVSRLSDVVSLRADQLRSEAAKRAEELRSEAARRAEDVRRLATEITGAAETPAKETMIPEKDLKAFGVTDELTEFVQGITPTTFRDFPLEDDTQLYGVDAVSNVNQDLSEWQERHAALVLSVVKEISKLRYELCPRFMKERKFWRIYFILVDRHVAPYEKRYMDYAKSKAGEQEIVVAEVKDVKLKDNEKGALSSSAEVKETDQTITPSKPESCFDQDLDAFLLGDPAESDGASDGNGGDFDEDFDKMLDGLDDDDDDEKGK